MNKNFKKYTYIQYLVNTIYFVFLMILGQILSEKLPNQLYTLDIFHFFLSLAIILIFYGVSFYILNFISIILHELGHLIFGLKANLTFVSFSVSRYTIYKENNKLKIKKSTKIPGALGICNMNIDINKKYNKQSIKLYYMGGIIFNIIFSIISILLIFFINNIYFKMIFILNIVINIYLAVYNSIPATTKSGAYTDALHIIYCLEDDEYINTNSQLQILQSLIAKGCDLKDIDTNLLSNPQTFKTNSDVLNAMIYVDYLISIKNYPEAIKYAKKIFTDAKELLSKQYVVSLKLQIITSIFYSNTNLEEIKEFWDEEIKKYLDLMWKIVPIFIGINYMYSTLIEKNEINSQKYLKQFQKLNTKNYDKTQIKETEELINDVNKKKENLKS